MADKALKELIEFASLQVSVLFKLQGEILPMYHAIRENGEALIIPPPSTNKDLNVAAMKALFATERVQRYVYIDEAYTIDAPLTDGADIAKAAREGLADHPDRREVVMFMAENKAGELLTGRRYILRPEHGKPKLSSLKLQDMTGIQTEGRMVGLLRGGGK